VKENLFINFSENKKTDISQKKHDFKAEPNMKYFSHEHEITEIHLFSISIAIVL
jgi:hypothetical protein